MGGRGGVGPTRLTIESSPPPSTSRGDQGAKALRTPFVLSHAEIPPTANAIGGPEKFSRPVKGRTAPASVGQSSWAPVASRCLPRPPVAPRCLPWPPIVSRGTPLPPVVSHCLPWPTVVSRNCCWGSFCFGVIPSAGSRVSGNQTKTLKAWPRRLEASELHFERAFVRLSCSGGLGPARAPTARLRAIDASDY